MGLIVKAGLDALGMKPQRIRHSMLGRFPPVELMAAITEEDEPSGCEEVKSTEIDEDSDGCDVDDLESVDSNDADSNADEEVADQEEEDDEQEDMPSYYKNRKAAYLLGNTYMMQLTKDMDTVNKKITRSSAHRADFNRRRVQANHQRVEDGLRPLKVLLSGHGIRWGIRAERWERMWEARALINTLMTEDLTEVHSKKRRPRKDGKKHGYFEEMIFSVADWQAMRDILDILTPYKILTREMEGDKPTGCMVLAKYVQLKSSMENRLNRMHENDPLYLMVDVMISKIITYLDESLDCDTIVLATLFNPGLRVKFFARAFGDDSNHHARARDLLESAFISQRDSPDFQSQTTDSPPPASTNTSDESDFFNLYNEVATSSNLNELERYLQGIDPMVSPDMSNPQCALDWWKTHAGKYPVLSILAQNYLATPAASAAPKRSFSIAGQVCTPERGGLAPQMIKMTVSGRIWAIEGVPFAGDFGEVGKF